MNVFNAPQDVLDWPVTVDITKVTIAPRNGVSFEFSKVLPENWKWPSNPLVPSDNFQYTVWPVITPESDPMTSGIVQMWQGRDGTGPFETPTFLTDFQKNWCYNAQWGPMAGYQPKAGDRIGFFVSAGNGRLTSGVTSVRERSNVVYLTLTSDGFGEWSFEQGVPAIPTDIPPAPIPVTPLPAPGSALNQAAIEAAILASEAKVLAAIADLRSHIDAGIRQIGDVYLPLLVKVFGAK